MKEASSPSHNCAIYTMLLLVIFLPSIPVCNCICKVSDDIVCFRDSHFSHFCHTKSRCQII